MSNSVARGRPFGEVQGRPAQLYVLENGVLRVGITDYGARLASLEAQDRAGQLGHVVLGFNDAAAYEAAGGAFGAVVGRTANRIAGGRMVIDGTMYRLSQNENGTTLQGGVCGFGNRFWSAIDGDAQHLTLALRSADGDQGFPGEVAVEAAYRLDGVELSLALSATTTKPTPLSLSAHPYFNLDGAGAVHCLDHDVEIFADAFLPTDRKQIPTGDVRPVDGTPFDFRGIRRIGARIGEPDEQLRYGHGYDHYFVLLPATGPGPRRAARVRSRRSGRVLDILTTQRGTQFYTGNNLDGSVAGRFGLYRQSAGFAIEPAGFPDAPNQPGFLSTILRPGERYRETIVYRFRSENQGDRD